MQGYIDRQRYLTAVLNALDANPVCAILGPRQCGKTSLARQVAQIKGNSHYFDLETATARTRLERAESTLGALDGLIVIDEIQRQPELFRTLRPLADRVDKRTRFLILGSASGDVVKGVSESLAGRVGFVDLSGFDLSEVGDQHQNQLWLRGGFPRSYLAASENASFDWRQDFIRTFLERDIPQLGIRIASETLRRFWMMVAHYHAQIWNGNELARALGVTERTVKHYLDILTGTFVLRQLQPWHENISKRQYKSPKVYVRDTGLLHALLSINSDESLNAHPKFGASWESFALEQILLLSRSRQAFFWGTHAGAELDLLLFHSGKRVGFEFKTSDAPDMTKSLHIALSDLQLTEAWIVYPGNESYAIHDKVKVAPLPVVLSKFAETPM